MKFAISSSASYAPKTEHIVVRSLLDSGVPAHDLYFFEGGHDGYTRVPCDYHKFRCPHDSMDFTALISVLELGLLDPADPRWFFLHDTVRVGPTFYSKITSMSDESVAFKKLTSSGPSMNMGAYDVTKIDASAAIARYKNTNENPQAFKSRLVEDEDAFIRDAPAYNDSPPNVSGPVDVYATGVPRWLEHYPDVDLTKIKANRCVMPEYVLTV